MLHEQPRRVTRDENKCLEPVTDCGAGNSRLNTAIKTIKKKAFFLLRGYLDPLCS